VRVNLDTAAYDDPRFARLGTDLGAQPEFALEVGLARMTRVWAYCTRRETHCLKAWEVDGFLRCAPGAGMALLVACGLARPEGDAFYIVGTRGRIEWYGTALANGKKGGRPKKPSGFPSGEPNHNHPDNHPVIHPGNHPQEKEKEDLSSSLPEGSAEGRVLSLVPPPKPPKPDPLEVYALYPRKEGKTPGIKRLAPQLKTAKDLEDAKQAARNYAARVAKEGREIKHIKLFSSWVSEWSDWVNPETTQPARASPASEDLNSLRARYADWDEPSEGAG
jgi:hypothetical protein